MAEADLDAVIRQTARAQTKALMAAAKKRQAVWVARAAKAKDKDTKAHFRFMAKSTMLNATATAKRLQNSAENAADAYARAIKKAMEEPPPAKKPAKKKEDA
ncbi:MULTISPECIES: hypothetical protein [unclassified Bradyrhizobium]|uniref:hypothetical protein n=1 Tax=unclassified Bradyrhizobium TaxID=2631580 RepID=UPI002479D52B|nr:MULTISPECIES: hypothetical protein [unclassified Bradyrhizobium]WGR94525.1 hypothetical protein MTX20_09840 [Bradyrhizobium sp. ISRA435]WGR99273.1 hypothetical protein MTX23_34680 [Bradyrhizobium sp. ISRA436]WGS06165.1 hypothetical protein MTX18_34700 [Bradyrhizobium sp. ISRA437]WGS13050.1 hypothetical protein MTX26_34700 [Bradyrhizobium sp. ISRA443]WGS20586.1 hypothetical protein MTX22_01780 [Bradyrhizobium sp. ISRA463]